MACRVPGANSPAEFWVNVRDGVESIVRLSQSQLRAAGVSPALLEDPNYVPVRAELSSPTCFDAGFFGFSPREAAMLDPQHRHFFACAWEALEDAGCVPERFDGSIGVFAGSGHNAYLARNLLSNPALVASVGEFLLRHTGNDKDFLATRLSYLLDLRGPSVAVQTACSTSLVAVHMACQSLISWECDFALAGAASIPLPLGHGYLYRSGEILSPDGRCRAFDAGAQGTVFGSGVGVVALRRLSDAVSDGDLIHAVIKGSAVNNDGARKVGYLAPSVDGQAAAIAEALEVSGVDPSTIGYVEAHGTGTPMGDPIEIAALSRAYGAGTDATGFCAIGSVKPNIGHLDTAAGIAGLIKAVLAIQHAQIPPVLHFEKPNPECRFASSPFRVPSSLTPWPHGPRRAGVSSLGVGGTNVHVVLEQAPLPQALSAAAPHRIAVSGHSSDALQANAQRLANCLEADAAMEATGLGAVARASWVRRRAFAYRGCVTAAHRGDAIRQLRALRPATQRGATSVAFVFAGGGARVPEEGACLLRDDPVAAAAVAECMELLDADLAQRLASLLVPPAGGAVKAAKALEKPDVGLPALFVAQIAHARWLESRGVTPSALLGHSMGELTAACLAGVLTLPDALQLVSVRGRVLGSVKRSGMVSVGLAEAELDLLPGLDLAVVNGPGLCVVSGLSAALRKQETAWDDLGVAHRRLRIDVAAHSRLLDPVLDGFRAAFEGVALHPPRIPVLSCLTGTWLTDEQAVDPAYWVRQMRETVRVGDGVKTLLSDAERAVCQVGPGSLTAVVRLQSGPGRCIVSTGGSADCDSRASARCAVADLWVAGVEVDVESVAGPGPTARLPTYAFAQERHWFARPENLSTPAPVQADGRRALADWFSEPQFVTPPAPTPAPLGTCIVYADGPQGRATVERLRASGACVAEVRRGGEFARVDGGFQLAPDGDASDLLRAVEEAHGPPDRVIYLWGLDGTAADAEAGYALHFDPLVRLAQAVGATGATLQICVVTSGLFGVEGAVADPLSALSLGPVLVVPNEHESVQCRLLDLPVRPDDDDVSRLVQELATVSTEPCLALRATGRWAPRTRARQVAARPTSASRVRWGGVYVVTGGLGGLGLAVAEHLAVKRARLVLVGRAGLPARDQWARFCAARGDADRTSRAIRRIEAMERLGAQVMVAAADVTDLSAMQRVFADARSRFGGLHGVFHTAGVLDDGPVLDKDLQAARRVLDPKVAGALVLDRLLRASDAELLVLFSSVSAQLGVAGQVDYAAANAFLDALATSRSGGPGPWTVSVAWGAWKDVGMAARLLGAEVGHGSAPTGGHPLLGVGRDGEFHAALGAADTWVLDEHRTLGGDAVLPGSALVEIVRAAVRGRFHERMLSLEEVTLVAPFVAPYGGRRRLRVEVESRSGSVGPEVRVTVTGSAGEEWIEHASATGRTVDSAPAPDLDLGAIRGRCDRGPAPRVAMRFGPHWDVVAEAWRGAGEVLLTLSLPEGLRGDAAQFGFHPALFDLATAGAQSLVPGHTPDTGLYVPWTFGRVLVRAPMGAECVSHIRLREVVGELAVFDATIADRTGRVLVEVVRVAMKRVDPGAFARPARTPLDGLREAVRYGIAPHEGVEALEQLLAAGLGPHVLVSPLPLTTGGSAGAAMARAPVQRAADAPPPVAPRTPLEREIAAVFEELLGIDEIGVDDDFFSLGGHSLLAVRLFARLQLMTRRNLPLSTLFAAPTVALLSVAFGGEDPESTAPPTGVRSGPRTRPPAPSATWRSLVPLRSGGGRTPFFCMHGRGGNVLNYRALLEHLDDEQPVYGLQARGLDGDTATAGSLEEMASHYIEEIRTVQKTGPYLLGGGSMGGTLAYEMAQQLLAMGERTALVAMFDTYGPQFFEFSSTGVPRGTLRARALAHGRALATRDVGGQIEYVSQRLASRLVDTGRGAWTASARALGRPLPHDLRYWDLERRNVELLGRYRPRPYGGRVVMFRALTQPEGVFADPGMGWGGLVQGSFQVVAIPGDHDTLVEQPELGRSLRDALAELAIRGSIGA